MRKFLCAVGFIFLISGCLSKLEDETGQTLDAVKDTNRIIKDTEEKQKWGTAFGIWQSENTNGRDAAFTTVIALAEPRWFKTRLHAYLKMRLPLNQPLVKDQPNVIMVTSTGKAPKYDKRFGMMPQSEVFFAINEAAIDMALNFLISIPAASLSPEDQQDANTLANRAGEVATAVMGARSQDTFVKHGGYYRDAVKFTKPQTNPMNGKLEDVEIEGAALRMETAMKLKAIATIWNVDAGTVALWKSLLSERMEIPWDKIPPLPPR